MNENILWGLLVLLILLLLVAFGLVFKQKIILLFKRRDVQNVKDIVEFRKAREVKQNTELRATYRDSQLTTGRVDKLTKSEKNRSFLTIDKVLSERDKSSMMMSFTADHHLKLDTIGAIEEEDPQKYNFDLEKDMPGTYLNTSAKNSTKNSHRKEFFVEFREKKKALYSGSASKGIHEINIPETDEKEESVPNLIPVKDKNANTQLNFDTDDAQPDANGEDEKVEYGEFDDEPQDDEQPPLPPRAAANGNA